MKMKKVLENQGLFLAEKERFELSRRLIPTYTLSRGASSANLSTSPYHSRRLAVFQACLSIIPHFLPFVNIFFHLFKSFSKKLRFFHGGHMENLPKNRCNIL